MHDPAAIDVLPRPNGRRGTATWPRGAKHPSEIRFGALDAAQAPSGEGGPTRSHETPTLPATNNAARRAGTHEPRSAPAKKGLPSAAGKEGEKKKIRLCGLRAPASRRGRQARLDRATARDQCRPVSINSPGHNGSACSPLNAKNRGKSTARRYAGCTLSATAEGRNRTKHHVHVAARCRLSTFPETHGS